MREGRYSECLRLGTQLHTASMIPRRLLPQSQWPSVGASLPRVRPATVSFGDSDIDDPCLAKRKNGQAPDTSCGLGSTTCGPFPNLPQRVPECKREAAHPAPRPFLPGSEVRCRRCNQRNRTLFTENLENDFLEVSSKTKKLGWSEGQSNPKCWLEKAGDSESQEDLFEGEKHEDKGAYEGLGDRTEVGQLHFLKSVGAERRGVPK